VSLQLGSRHAIDMLDLIVIGGIKKNQNSSNDHAF
jgi:hypothetical protein